MYVWPHCLGIFSGVLVDLSRNFEDYITIDHAVDRSLFVADVGTVCKLGVVSPVRCGELGW